MNGSPAAGETFKAFKNSFFYGTRADMNFKFVQHLTEDAAGEFFQGLLAILAKAYDTGDTNQIFDYTLKWQAAGYDDEKNYAYTDGPFAKLSGPVKDATVALLTSSGHFTDGNDPEPFGLPNMTQKEAEQRIFDFLKLAPVLSEIPREIPATELKVRHGGYDVNSSRQDANTTFPLGILANLATEGVIGCLATNAYSFVGACSQMRLLKQSGPDWAAKLLDAGAAATILVPV